MTLIDFLFRHTLVPSALAAGGPCVGVGCGIGGNPLPLVITVVASVLLEIASGLSVLFVVIGGAQLLLNFGNDSMAEKGRKNVIYSLIGFAIALSSQAIISFAVVRAGLVDADAPHLSIMRITLKSMLFVMNVVFALVMLFFGFKLVIARGQQSEMDTTKKGIGYAVAGAILINLSYALVRATSLLGF